MNEFTVIKGHERYEINCDGIIRNAETKAIKSQYIGSTGYCMVSFSYQNKSKTQRVHRLLMSTFSPIGDENAHINHKNGDKIDNRLANLEWCTHQENMTHAFRYGLANNTGEKNGQSKLTEIQVKKIKLLLSQGVTQQKIANEYGVSRSCILGIHVNRLWSHVFIPDTPRDAYEQTDFEYKGA